jgi:DNA uptake protein ComE-like DNA-binding protein
VEVNTCDSAQLVALPGIGPSFARGIIKYRDQLGGYVSLDQLAEVLVLQNKPDVVARIKGLVAIDTLRVRRIPINTCSVEQLAAHPYLRWGLAKPLAAYRDRHGPFRNVEAIKGCAVITDEVYRRIAPYLSVE